MKVAGDICELVSEWSREYSAYKLAVCCWATLVRNAKYVIPAASKSCKAVTRRRGLSGVHRMACEAA
jgi:hypothetical protein